MVNSGTETGVGDTNDAIPSKFWAPIIGEVYKKHYVNNSILLLYNYQLTDNCDQA
jgi:hypothetical protein